MEISASVADDIPPNIEHNAVIYPVISATYWKGASCMFAVLQQIFPCAFGITWAGVTAILYFRFRAKQRAYLHEFPSVAGVPLDMFIGGNPLGAVARAVYQAMWQHQPDPQLERLRHEMWRRYVYIALWVLGFPLLTYGAVALLIVTGYVR